VTHTHPEAVDYAAHEAELAAVNKPPETSVVLSIVRRNLLTRPGYTPYCGNEQCNRLWPRTHFNQGQFECGCGWRSTFEPEFIAQLPHSRSQA
jgi:hypothetical protein